MWLLQLFTCLYALNTVAASFYEERLALDAANTDSFGARGNSPRLVAGGWSTCSRSCGAGIATRSVDCVTVHPITGNIIRLPLSDCESMTQPASFKPCDEAPCPLNEEAKATVDESAFRWQHGEWGSCSASCLGGKQKAALKCVEVATGRNVAWSECDARRRPPEKLRICNAQACPPTWKTSPFSTCSASCGGGRSERQVRCVRALSSTGGADAEIVLSDSHCQAPKPTDSQACGNVHCSPEWITGSWTECSTSCGSGEQRRDVSCEARDAKGRRTTKSESECKQQKPSNTRMCSLGPCDKTHLQTNRVFSQKESENRLTLSIGGVATLYQGTSLKIKCPRKKFDKKKIFWTKNGRRIRNDAHIKVSSNGHLRIFHARVEDSAFYECYSDTLLGNVTLHFKLRDDKGQSLTPTTTVVTTGKKDENITFIEALLASATDAEAAQQLQRYAHLIRASWQMTEWSECKQATCAVAGYQARSVACNVNANNNRKVVDDDVCIFLAGTRPAETRPCHQMECPRWEASDWTECASSRCARHKIAVQQRTIRCVLSNGTDVNLNRCDTTIRPKSKRECDNPLCKAHWVSSDWGNCSSNCGSGGVQLRLLSCVWAATSKAAGRNCEHAARPSAARACVPQSPLPACEPEAIPQKDDSRCHDNSRLCGLTRLFHSCSSEEVRRKCCATCTELQSERKF